MVLSDKEIYGAIVKQKYLYFIFFAIMVFLAFLIDISVGSASLSVNDVFTTIISPNINNPTANVIVWDFRLPKALMAILIGASLSVAGAEVQTILDNPLASPYTLGISAAAGFGAALALVFGFNSIVLGSNVFVSTSAFILSLIAFMTIFLVAKRKTASKEVIVLAGIALLFLFQALISLLQYTSTDEQLQKIVFWLFGSLEKSSWGTVSVCLTILLIALPLLAIDFWKLTALKLGDEKAKSLGINVEKLRLKVLLYVSILTASAVSFVGMIGFVGLVPPHIARILVGEDQRYFVPLSALLGSLFLSLASIGSKIICEKGVFPIGIATSIIGVPFFLSLILMKRGYSL
ncbi:iron ABC transporter permease [Methanolobus sp. ZRKC2]|uniref:FecCD family ABC transporter permease n=1 Tax=Methanolobus sp. ZRKC2 TaxID=3125783 RepID=UPI00324F7C75